MMTVEQILARLRALEELAIVANEGDPWYAEHEGLDAEATIRDAREAIAEVANRL